MIFRKQVLFFIFVILAVHSLYANPALESWVTALVRRILILTSEQSAVRGEVRLSKWLIEEETQKISRLILLRVEPLPKEKMARELELLLNPRELLWLADDVRVAKVLRESQTEFGLARHIMANQFLSSLEAYTPPTFLEWIIEKGRRIISRGEKLNQEEVLNFLLTKGQNPEGWIKEIEAKVVRGGVIQAEELVAASSLLHPFCDRIFSEAIDSVLFRQALVIEFWKKHPESVQYFFGRILGVISPQMTFQNFPRIMADFPVAVFNATHTSRRSAFFLFGFPKSYANNKITAEIASQWIRLQSIQSLETTGLLGDRSYREFIVKAIANIENKGRIYKLTHAGELQELRRQLDLLNRYQEAFQNTPFDVFSNTLVPKDILEVEVWKMLDAQYRGEWWGKNIKWILVMTILGVVEYYLSHQPEAMMDPSALDVRDIDILNDIDLKIELSKIKLQSETDPEKIQRIQEYILILETERGKYTN